jgi:hypothetical protein
MLMPSHGIGQAVAQVAAGMAETDSTARPRHAHIFERDPHGHYVEPLWCSVRLFEAECFGAPGARVFDPCCGWGRILRAAQSAGFTPIGCDIVDRRGDLRAFADFPFSVCDFLTGSPVRSAWAVVCNPPFDRVEEFCRRALDVATYKVAMLVPLRRLPAAHWLQRLPLESVYLLTPRPSMPTGAYIAAGKKPSGDTKDYAWLVFNKQSSIGREPKLRWLHRDRRRS